MESIKDGQKDLEAAGALSSYVQAIFESFKVARLPFEETWEECWYNFIGQYQESKVWKRKTEGQQHRSRIFIKLTGLKCHTAHSKIVDALFAGRIIMPFEVEAINVEELGIPEQVASSLATRMKEKIEAHFKKIKIKKKIDLAILEMSIFGTSILKGPIISTKRVAKVRTKQVAGIPLHQIDTDVSPYEVYHVDEMLPDIDRISIWEYYADPNARSQQDSIGEIQFQRLSPSQFRLLARQGGYNTKAVFEAARRATTDDPNDKTRIQLADKYTGVSHEKDNRVSVLEYWGLVPVAMLKAAGVECPEDVDDEDSIEALVVLAADGIVIKACINPLGRRPFFVCPFKSIPGQIYGVGPAESMRDSQKMINSAARLYIDNKALSGNGMVGINLDRVNTKRTQNLDVYTGKTWYIKGNFAPREAIDTITFPDITFGLQELISTFERFADEETGIPKYSSGAQADWLNKTATGMSMLITQMNINLKTVIENIDDHFIEPIVEAFGEWFRQFSDDDLLSLPLKYKATGTDSLMAKEIKLENYMRFMQLTSSPQDAIFVDRAKQIRMLSKMMDTEDVVRSEAEIMSLLQNMPAQNQGPSAMTSPTTEAPSHAPPMSFSLEAQ